MKRPKPDIADQIKATFVQRRAFINKFLRYWGTTTVSGVEVFNLRHSFWRSPTYPKVDPTCVDDYEEGSRCPTYTLRWPIPDNTVKLLKFLGTYSQVKDINPKGIRDYYLYLNPKKEGVEDLDKGVLAANLNTAINSHIKNFSSRNDLVVDDEGIDHRRVDVTLTISGKPKYINKFGERYWDNKTLDPITYANTLANQDLLIQEIKDTYQAKFNEGYSITTDVAEDKYMDTLVKYLLLDSATSHYTVNSVRTGITSVTVAYEHMGITSYRVVNAPSYALSVSIRPRSSFTSLSPVVDKIHDDVLNNTSYNLLSVRRIVNSTDYDTGETTTSSYIEFPYTSDVAYWVTSGSNYYLRRDFLDNPALSLGEKVAFLGSIIDTGYTKRRVSRWRRFITAVLVIVIIVVAVILSVKTAGKSLKAGMAATAAIITIASVITMAALFISIAAYAASLMGMTEVSLSLGKFLEAAAPLIKLAGVIALIGNLYMGFQKGFQNAAMDVALDQGIDLAQVAVTDVVMQMARNTVTDMTMTHTMKLVELGMELYQRNQMKDLANDLKSMERELAELEAAREQSTQTHAGLDMIQSTKDMLRNDWSHYDNIYDRPYEWYATAYHTGNMQATTVSAFWTTDDKNGIMRDRDN